MFGIHRNFPAGGSTGDATAEQWHIKNGLDAYIASGKVTGTGYFPAMMKFDGSTGYYQTTAVTIANNVFTMLVRFQRATFTGGLSEYIVSVDGATAAQPRAAIWVDASDHATSDRQGRVLVNARNTSFASICFLASNTVFTDDEPHTVFFEFNATAGTAILRIDGNNEDNGSFSQRVLTTGTLETGSGGVVVVGASNQVGAPIRYLEGSIGFFGYRDVGGLSWSDFMQADGTPKNIESTLNTVWGAQPLFWNESGYMQDNKGSAGAMTANGTIVLAAASDWS